MRKRYDRHIPGCQRVVKSEPLLVYGRRYACDYACDAAPTVEPFAEDESDEEATPAWSEADLARMRKILARLPAEDRDFVDLYISGVTESQIAKIFGLTQGAVSYRIGRVMWRLRWLYEHPDVLDITADEIRQALTTLGVKPRWVDILVSYAETTSQKETARRLGTSQGDVCYAVRQTVLRLASAGEAYSRYHRLFTDIRGSGQNVLHAQDQTRMRGVDRRTMGGSGAARRKRAQEKGPKRA